MSDARTDILNSFLTAEGWGNTERTTIAGDASFRRYDRLTANGRSAILMDAPPPMEDVRPFITIAKHLFDLGFSAPEIFAADEEQGFLLLEDLGDDTYTRLLARGEDEAKLYELATDVLTALHQVPVAEAVPEGTPIYETERLVTETGRVLEWYCPLLGMDAVSQDVWAAHDSAWRQVLPSADNAPESLILADYHVDNLLGLFDRPGIKACGLLDFQDAARGPAVYDLMSLIDDARRDVSPDLAKRLMDRYTAAFPDLDPDVLGTTYAVMAAQRHARIIGTFARLNLRDGKPEYLSFLPRVWRQLEHALAHPALAPVRIWYDGVLPESRRRLPT